VSAPVEENPVSMVSPPSADAAAAVAVTPIPVAALATADATVSPRFCTRCGAPADPAGGPCLACVRQQTLAPSLIADDGSQRSIKGALALYFALLAVCVIGIIAGLAGASELRIDVFVSISISVVVLAGALISWRGVLPLLARIPGPRWFLTAVGLSLVTIAVAFGVIRGLQHLMHVPDVKMSTPYLEAGYGWGAVILAVCVQPAIFEELAFRGTVMSALSKALSPFETIMVSALMFMILHMAPARFPHTLALGLAAGYLRHRTASLYPCILLHFCHNFTCVAAEWANW
jgi:membrane protease YdiL (CAAX protease family)